MGDIFEKLAAYFIMTLGGSWIIEKLFGSSIEIYGVAVASSVQVYMSQGRYFVALFFAALVYLVYFVAAGVVSDGTYNTGGKVVVAVIGCYLLGSMVSDLYDAINLDKSVGSQVPAVIFYLIWMLEDVVKIIATFHGLKTSLRG